MIEARLFIWLLRERDDARREDGDQQEGDGESGSRTHATRLGVRQAGFVLAVNVTGMA
jgi:hypothetical protein